MATPLLPSAAVPVHSTSTATASPYSPPSYPSPPTNFLLELKSRASTPSIHSVTSFLRDPFVVVSAVAESLAYFGGRSRKRSSSSEQQGPSTPPSPSAVVVDHHPTPTLASSSPSPSPALEYLALLAANSSTSKPKAPKPLQLQLQTTQAEPQKLAVDFDASRPSLLSISSASSLLSTHQNDCTPPPLLPSPILIPVKTSSPQLDADPLSEYLFERVPSKFVVGRGAQRRALGLSLAFKPQHYRADEEGAGVFEGPASIRGLTVLNRHLGSLLQLFDSPPALSTSPLPRPTLLSVLALFATPPAGARWGEVAQEVLLAMDVLSKIKEEGRRTKWVKSYVSFAKDVVNERLQEEWILLDKERVLPTRQEISLDGWRRAKVTDILVQVGLIISHEARASLDILVHRGSFDSSPLEDSVFELCSYDASAATGVRELVASGFNSNQVAAKLFRMARQIRAAKQNQQSPEVLLPNPKRLAQVLAPLLAKTSSTSTLDRTPSSPLPDAITSLQKTLQPTTSISFCTASSLDPDSTSFLIAPPPQLINPTKNKTARRPSPPAALPPPPPSSSFKPQPQPQRRGSATPCFSKGSSNQKARPKPMRRKSSQRVASPLPVVSPLPVAEPSTLEAGPPPSNSNTLQLIETPTSSTNLLVVSPSPSLKPVRAPTRGRSFLVSSTGTKRGKAARRF